MQCRFDILFQVEVVHEYFRDGTSADSPENLFEVHPTAECQQRMQDLGLLLRRTTSGFTVLYRALDSNQPQQSLLQNTSDLNLRFYLTARDPNFFYYTDMPIDAPANACFYLHNKTDNQQNLDGQNRLLLSRGTGSAFVGDLDQALLKSAQFPFAFELAADTALVSIRDQAGTILYSKQLDKLEQAQGNNPNPFETYLDLSHLVSGVYSIWVDANQIEQFYLETEQSSAPPFAIIDLYADAPTDYSFVDSSGVVSSKRYQIRFNRRETIWKYLIALKQNSTVNETDLQVISSNVAATFVRKSSIELADATRAVPFESDPTLLPLLHKPLKGFSLQRTLPGPGPGSTEETPLPTPTIRQLSQANGKIYSEVYVYI